MEALSERKNKILYFKVIKENNCKNVHSKILQVTRITTKQNIMQSLNNFAVGKCLITQEGMQHNFIVL